MCATYFEAPALCGLAECYDCLAICVAIVNERVILFVQHCIVHGIRGCVYHLLRGTCSLYTFVVCTGVLCYTLHSTWDFRVFVPFTSRHLLCVSVSQVLRMCCHCE